MINYEPDVSIQRYKSTMKQKNEIICDTDKKIQNYNETKKSCNEIREQMWPV